MKEREKKKQKKMMVLIVAVVVVVVVMIMYIPAKDGHDKCHCRQHVTHSAREGRGGEFKPRIVKILVNHWSAKSKNIMSDKFLLRLMAIAIIHHMKHDLSTHLY